MLALRYATVLAPAMQAISDEVQPVSSQCIMTPSGEDDPAPIRITVLFFASAREAAGNTRQTEICFTGGADTAILRQILAERYPPLAATVLNDQSVTLALNEEYVPPGQVLPLRTGDVVALIPPISGG